MSKKSSVDELLGPTPIARVSDDDIWKHMISPLAKCYLGPITNKGKQQILETAEPLFPGDEITNLNNHLLYGGKTGYVRFPYLATIHKTANGVLVIKRDAVKFKASGWYGDPFKGKAELIYKVALRDRRFDGTLRANDSAVLDYCYDSSGNTPLPGNPSSLEVSIYAFQPRSRISAVTGEAEYEAFVANPFTFLDRPELFLSYFNRAWSSQLAPGQVAAPIPDVAAFIAPKFDFIAKKKGYDFLEDAASHYHVAMFAQSAGFRCTYQDQLEQLTSLKDSIQAVKANTALTRSQESWICVLQSLRPAELIPKHLNMGGPYWPQNNIDQNNLWMNKPLTKQAIELLPGQIKR
ncbi:MAG: hypothetical protein K2W82_10995 [Candidatus Obscuribacterales bacterium]|nr:hypothetical protein [Candidatus Obscuribacterales bacterium]